MSDRYLNTVVAGDIMGLARCDAWQRMNFGSAGGPVRVLDPERCKHGGACFPYGEAPPYLSDETRAFEVVDRMRELGFHFEMYSPAGIAHRYALANRFVRFSSRTGEAEGRGFIESNGYARAICVAALFALNRRRRLVWCIARAMMSL
jgi:hypothetical protein